MGSAPFANGTFNLKVVATATEEANQDCVRSEASLAVTVLPVNDAPLANDASFELTEGGSFTIDFASLISDVDDGDVLTLSFAKPKHGTLTRNADGTYSYTPRRGFTGTESFTYTVSDGTLSTTATISLVVRPKPVDHHDHGHHHNHHDHGRHGGFDHSGHYGYDGHGGTSCSISAYSGFAQGHDEDRATDHHNDRFIVIRRGDSYRSYVAPQIDWNGGQAHCLSGTQIHAEDWAADFAWNRRDGKTLAEITGLSVTMTR